MFAMSDQKRLFLSVFSHFRWFCSSVITSQNIAFWTQQEIVMFFSVLKLSGRKHKVEFVSCLCVCLFSQAQLETSEQEIQEMIRHRIRKIEEIRMSLNELEVEQTHSMTNL